MDKFGEYLRRNRKDKRITLVELAKETGLSQPYLSQIENGKRNTYKPDVLRKLSVALDIPYNDIVEKAGLLDVSKEKEEELNKAIDTIKDFEMFMISKLGINSPLFLEGIYLSDEKILQILSYAKGLIANELNKEDN